MGLTEGTEGLHIIHDTRTQMLDRMPSESLQSVTHVHIREAVTMMQK
jgi:hypothetical protein